MKDIRLKSLRLENFKGIRDLSIEFGKTTNIFGDNKTGKTTVADAFFWLLFDKNSANETKFEIKTLDEKNNVIHNLEHIVEGVISVNNKGITLKKVFKGVYRGYEFQNKNTTDYYVNDLKVAKKEYDQEVSEIVNEDLFKLLTNPLHFSTNLKVEERRKIILDLIEQPETNEILENGNFKLLPEELETRTVEDVKKLMTQRIKESKKEVETLPEVIKATESKIKSLAINKSVDEINAEIKELENKEVDLVSKIATANTSDLKVELSNLSNEISVVKFEEQKLVSNKQELIKMKISNLEFANKERSSEITNIERRIENNNDNIKYKDKQLNDFRNEYKNLQATQFIASECSSCGQALPVEKTEELKAKFNLDKSNKLKDNASIGSKIASELKELQLENERLGIEVVKLTDLIEKDEDKILALKSELEKVVYVKSNDLLDLETKRLELEEKLSNSDIVDTTDLQNDLTEIRDSKNILIEERSKISILKSFEEEVISLREKLKEQNKIYLESELLKQEAEEYDRIKLQLSQDRINSLFDLVEIRLFTYDMSGRINDDCTALVDGVPFGNSLNNAGRTQAGIDIIKALQRHYGIKAPIIIDNAESITSLPDLDSQLIRLVVEEKDKTLRIEKGE